MEKRQIDQYNMLLAVEHHFENNEPLWTSNVPLSDAKAALTAKISEIMTAMTVQSESSTGATMDKALLRTDLEEKGFFICSAINAYASVNPNLNQQLKKADLTKKDFNRFRGADLLVAIGQLYTAATSVIVPLLPYGVTPATLTELLAAADAFRSMISEPEDVTSLHKDATDAIPVLLHEAIAMLDKTIDILMGMLRVAQPQFVNVYFIERKIHHIGVRTLSLEITTLNGHDNTPLEGAYLEVVGKGIKRISTEKGQNRIQNLVEGNYTLSVSCLDFVPQMIPFSVMNHQTTQLVIEMQKVLTSVPEQEEAEE